MEKWWAPRWVAVWYTLLTLVMTWPLVLGLGRDMPWDFGDSLLNCWIIAWNSDHFLAALGGNVGALSQLWHGNIFHPEPYALAYSELLIAQSIQGLPLYAATGNIILVYDVLFLSTYILSAFGAYLFVRQLTGDDRVAFVVGVVYGFLPYRADQGTHLHILSSQWMPFALYGLRRYFDTGRLRALAGGTAAIIAQNLSSGYFLIYFAFALPPYVLWELAVRRRVRDWPTWRALLVAGACVAVCTVPFMLPYLELRALTGAGRSIEETASFSADLLAYVTADSNLRIWGGILDTWPKPEGDLFPGLVLSALAACGIALAARGACAAARSAREPHAVRRQAGWRRTAVVLALVIAAVGLVLVVVALLGLRTRLVLGPLELRYRDVLRPLVVSGAALVFALALSASARAVGAALARHHAIWFGVCAVVAAYLSLGPTPAWGGLPMLDTGLYRWFFEHVPGVDGLRVPARLGMLVMLFLLAPAGAGAAWLLRHSRRPAVVTMTVAIAALAEGAVVPLPLNQMATYAEFGAPPAYVEPATRLPAVYAHVASLPTDSAIIEFPIGETGWDIRAVYYAAGHRKPVVNGYSGGFPSGYVTLAGFLYNPYAQPDAAWAALTSAGATHAVVHHQAYQGSVMRDPGPWLTSRGARVSGVFIDATVYALPRNR